MFPDVSSPLPDSFQLNESHKCDMEWWDNFFGSVTDNPNSLPKIKTFKLPKISFATKKSKHWSVLPLLIDAGIRNVDVVTSAQSNAG